MYVYLVQNLTVNKGNMTTEIEREGDKDGVPKEK